MALEREVSGTGARPDVRLLVHPRPVRVAYAAVRELVPRLWDGDTGGEEAVGQSARHIDLMVHVGMAGAKSCYALVHRGHRSGYKMAEADSVRRGYESRKGEDVGRVGRWAG